MALERNSGENGRLVRMPAGPVVLEGNLALPGDALGVVCSRMAAEAAASARATAPWRRLCAARGWRRS
jgi:hypothetical protein